MVGVGIRNLNNKPNKSEQGRPFVRCALLKCPKWGSCVRLQSRTDHLFKQIVFGPHANLFRHFRSWNSICVTPFTSKLWNHCGSQMRWTWVCNRVMTIQLFKNSAVSLGRCVTTVVWKVYFASMCFRSNLARHMCGLSSICECPFVFRFFWSAKFWMALIRNSRVGPKGKPVHLRNLNSIRFTFSTVQNIPPPMWKACRKLLMRFLCFAGKM